MDAGPLVAWLCPKDSHHNWAQRAFPTLRPGCLICEAVVTEACHLVGRDGVSPLRVIEFVNKGRLKVVPLAVELPVIHELMAQYQDQRMDFADACVVRLAELHEGATVCTTDGDFKVYRRHGRREIRLLAPWV